MSLVTYSEFLSLCFYCCSAIWQAKCFCFCCCCCLISAVASQGTRQDRRIWRWVRLMRGKWNMCYVDRVDEEWCLCWRWRVTGCKQQSQASVFSRPSALSFSLSLSLSKKNIQLYGCNFLWPVAFTPATVRVFERLACIVTCWCRVSPELY